MNHIIMVSSKKIVLITGIIALCELCMVFAEPMNRFIKNGDNTITDTKTGLMWAAKDNGSPINWHNALIYCRNFKGGGYTNWRMPTLDELKTLFVRDKDYKGYETDCGQKIRIVQEIKLSCGWVWASEAMTIDFKMKGRQIKRRTISARAFNFHRGYPYTDLMRHLKNYRALPVRDLQDGK